MSRRRMALASSAPRSRAHDTMWPWLWPWFWLMGPSSVTFRAAMPADSWRMADIHASGFALGWARGELEQMILPTQHAADVLISRGLFGDMVSGFAISRIVAGEAELLTIVLEPDCRGSGLSAELLATHLRSVRQAGGETLFLEVAADNAPALALYRKAGFDAIGRRKGYYAASNGEPRRDALTMRADLSGLDPTPRYA
jgi:[ribosomal protein S18]-alanine N-acetyltransferase